MWHYCRGLERKVSVLHAMEARAKTIREALARACETVRLSTRAGAPVDVVQWMAKCCACEWRVCTMNAASEWQAVMSRRFRRGLIENIYLIFGTWIFEIIYLACTSRLLPILCCALWRNSSPCLRVQAPPLARQLYNNRNQRAEARELALWLQFFDMSSSSLTLSPSSSSTSLLETIPISKSSDSFLGWNYCMRLLPFSLYSASS